MTSPNVVLEHATKNIPECSPNLMPFHIDYTGPAAVSTFMRIEKLKIPEQAETSTATTALESSADAEMSQATTLDEAVTTPTTEVPESESQATLVASTSASQAVTPSSSTATIVAEPPPPPPLEDADRRFVTSFRGRTIHGLTIDLPEGYGGLVLQSKASGGSGSSGAEKEKEKLTRGVKAKASTRGKEKATAEEAELTSGGTRPRRGRLTRSAVPSKKPIEIVEDEDVVMKDAAATPTVTVVASDDADSTTKAVEGQSAEDDEGSVKRLIPSAQFSAFTLWQPDRVVDKNRDEYYRSLTEWVSLANEVRSMMYTFCDKH